MKYTIIVLLLLLSFSQEGFTQDSRKKRPSVEAYDLLEIAKKQMAEGDFSKANLTFRKMLQLKSVLPTEMSYLFAETLFKVGQYENSMNFLKKYQGLTDRGSDYYLLSIELEKQLGEKLNEIAHCQLCDRFGYRLTSCSVCHEKGKLVQECHRCRGLGIVTCHVCSGNGVLISTNQFNEKEYRTCETCASKGIIPCPVCDGKKEIVATCPNCNGTGHEATAEICTHVARGGD